MLIRRLGSGVFKLDRIRTLHQTRSQPTIAASFLPATTYPSEHTCRTGHSCEPALETAFLWLLLDFLGESSPTHTCITGTKKCPFLCADAISLGDTHKRVMICCNNHHNSGHLRQPRNAIEDIENSSRGGTGMAFGSGVTNSMNGPRSSPMGIGPPGCKLHTSPVSCTCSSIVSSMTLGHLSTSVIVL